MGKTADRKLSKDAEKILASLPDAPPGSPAAVLSCFGLWKGEKGEVDALMDEVTAARATDLSIRSRKPRKA